MNLYELHGLLQFTIFIFIFPIGAMIAIFRESIGPSWRKFHVGFQLTGVALFLVAISLAIYMGSKYPKDKNEQKKSNIKKIHHIVGRVLAMVILFQVLWAFYGRKYVDWMTWYYVHMALAATIILGGWTNIALAIRMKKSAV